MKTLSKLFLIALDSACPPCGGFKLSSLIASLIGYSPIVIPIVVPNAAKDTDVIAPTKLRIIGAHFVKTNATGVGSAKTVTLKNKGNAITNAIDIAVADTTIVRAGTINDATHVVAKGDAIRVTCATTGQDASGILYVEAIREA